jgi:hypothetical protein
LARVADEIGHERKRRLASGTAKALVNPIVRALFRLGLPAPGTALLETIGRKSGEPRATAVHQLEATHHEIEYGDVRLLQTDPTTIRIDLDGGDA